MLPIVLKEPLVDCVELKSVVTKPCLIKVSRFDRNHHVYLQLTDILTNSWMTGHRFEDC
jgi:hypothetical protein